MNVGDQEDSIVDDENDLESISDSDEFSSRRNSRINRTAQRGDESKPESEDLTYEEYVEYS